MNRPDCRIAVAGATGAVGTDIIRVLEKRGFPVGELRLLASSRSVGKEISYCGDKIKVQELSHDSFQGIDVAIFSAGASRSKEFAPSAVKAGAVVVDNSSAFRMVPEVPLVVPEVNPEDIEKHNGIIANPNCSTIIMVVVVYPLHRAKGLVRMVASTYQAASGAGAQAMRELLEQSKDVLDGREAVASAFPRQIAFNLFPHIDVFLENGYSKEEMKMVNEARKIMHAPDLKVSCTCVRVPVVRAHSEALNMEFRDQITVGEARDILASAPGVALRDDLESNVYPTPIEASGMDDVLVGRIRRDCSRDDGRGLDMFISGDQLLKGAALNAVQIAERLI